jgi:putative tryptophan/tyrosine transport system substrate-binding protein
MRRRDFISLVGSSVAAWPFVVHAQQPPSSPIIGYLSTGTRQSDETPFLAAFRDGLRAAGYTEGKNVGVEYRWAEFQMERLPALAGDLVRRQVAAIAAIGGTPPALVAKTATTTIPVVFYLGIDPVQFGLVISLNHPGGNMTGVAALQADLVAKRVQVLHELVPKAGVIALLVNPTNRYTETEANVTQESARSLGLKLRILSASNAGEIDAAFSSLGQASEVALLVSADLFLLSRREQIVAQASARSLPTIYGWREYVAAGGLMSYGPNLYDAYRLVGVYTGKILNGASPADLPVEQTTKVDFVINQKTAKLLGLTYPLPLLGRADEVIE